MDDVEAVFKDDLGNEVARKLDLSLVGRLFCNLETARELLGHKTIKSALRYVHGEITQLPEYKFIEGIVMREGGQWKKT